MLCPHFARGTCRSCTDVGRPYADQLAAKERHCREVLAVGGFSVGGTGVDGTGAPDPVAWLPPVASAEAGYRNKAKMVVAGSVDAPTLGILDPEGRGVDLQDCPLYPPALAGAFPALAAFVTRAAIEPYDVAARRGELKYLLVTASPAGELMVRLVLRSQEPVARIRKHLPALLAELPQAHVVSVNLQPVHQAVLEGDREIVLTPDDTLPMPVGDVELLLRPQSFFQTNTPVAAALYRQARDWVADADPASVWDLYCGVGGFALHVADGGRDVLGVEVSPAAIASAEASRDRAGLRRVRFLAGDATAFALAAPRAPELVVVNPPRRGIGAELAGWLEASDVRHVVYSSCNVTSLARDLAAMPSLRVRAARVLDMFPQTAHYEVVTLLERA